MVESSEKKLSLEWKSNENAEKLPILEYFAWFHDFIFRPPILSFLSIASELFISTNTIPFMLVKRSFIRNRPSKSQILEAFIDFIWKNGVFVTYQEKRPSKVTIIT